MTAETAPLTRQAAETLLRQFICIESIPADQMPTPAAIQQALLLLCDQSDYQLLGVCADSAEQAIAALHAYLAAFGLTDRPIPAEAITGAVYLKYNPKTGLCYLKPYTGDHRGVLVSCQSAYDGDVNETFGHLPLDLFAPVG